MGVKVPRLGMSFEKVTGSASSFHDSACGKKVDGHSPGRGREDQRAGFCEAIVKSLRVILESQRTRRAIRGQYLENRRRPRIHPQQLRLIANDLSRDAEYSQPFLVTTRMVGELRLARDAWLCRCGAEGNALHRSRFRSDKVTNGTSWGAKPRRGYPVSTSREQTTPPTVPLEPLRRSGGGE